MSDPNGNTLTWYKEGSALPREERGLMCDVIPNHVGLLQRAVMWIVSASGSANKINTVVGDLTLSWSRRAHPAACAGSEGWPMLWFWRC